MFVCVCVKEAELLRVSGASVSVRVRSGVKMEEELCASISETFFSSIKSCVSKFEEFFFSKKFCVSKFDRPVCEVLVSGVEFPVVEVVLVLIVLLVVLPDVVLVSEVEPSVVVVVLVVVLLVSDIEVPEVCVVL